MSTEGPKTNGNNLGVWTVGYRNDQYSKKQRALIKGMCLHHINCFKMFHKPYATSSLKAFDSLIIFCNWHPRDEKKHDQL